MPTQKLTGTDYIYQRIASDGRITSYQVRIRRKGFPHHNASFHNLADAKRLVRRVLTDQDRGHKVDRLVSHQMTVGDVIEGAIVAIDTGRRRTKGMQSERLRLAAFKRDYPSLCQTTLADATEDMFEDWIAERLEVVKPNTVLRDFTLLKPLFAVAARKYNLRFSPLQYIKPPRINDERVRRILPEEEVLLFSELLSAQDSIVHSAAQFALATGCRRSECLRIAWPDFDPQRGTIWLADAKNGRGRYLLLTEQAQRLVETLPGRKEGGGDIQGDRQSTEKGIRVRAGEGG